MKIVYTYENIAAKAAREGGWDEALDWFKVEEVPESIRLEWKVAKSLKRQLNEALDNIIAYFPEELQ